MLVYIKYKDFVPYLFWESCRDKYAVWKIAGYLLVTAGGTPAYSGL